MATIPFGYMQQGIMGGSGAGDPLSYSWEQQGAQGSRMSSGMSPGRPDMSPASGGYSQQPGFNYGALAPAIGTIGGGIGQWIQGNNMASMMQGLSGPLPFQSDLEDTAGMYRQQARELEAAHATPAMLQAARNASRQAAAGQGISGPLTASVEAQGVIDTNQQFEQWRRQMLGNVLQQRAAIIQQLQQQAMMSRAARAQAAMARQQAGGGIGSAIGTGAGAILGGILAPFTGGASLALGPALGGALGNTIGSAASGGGEGY